MTFISYQFLLGSAAAVIFYYLLPTGIRWITLLIFSILFYLQGGPEGLLTVLLTTLITYLSALLIGRTDQKKRRKRRVILSCAVLLLAGYLALTKLSGYVNISPVIPVGISYYTFSLISYLADVYWKKEQAERNFLKLALFALYAPKILQGPISKHRTLGPQLTEGHAFSYKNLTFGMQRMIWGLFKKLVIANRTAIFVNNVYNGDLADTGGAVLALTVFLSVMQLYCDFSGCMDIACGLSQIFGIELDENFKRPFFSRSAAEFWRRWHITLGIWFKDYVYMPIVISPGMLKISGFFRKKISKRCGKAVLTVIPLSLVWILTGLWHGTGINYVIWGIYWGCIIILSEVFAPEIRKLTALLHINTKAPTWRWFQMIRTFALFYVGRLIASQKSPEDVKTIVRNMIWKPEIAQLMNGELFNYTQVKADLIVIALSLVLLWFISLQQEKHGIRESIAAWNAVPRWIFYGVSIGIVLVFGVYGAGYENTLSFAYQFF